MRGLAILVAVLTAAGAVAWFGFGANGGAPDGDDVMRLIYLGLILALVSSGLLGSGIGLGNGLRSFAIWAAIAIALVGGYQYRYELQDIASRLTAGLIPGSPISNRDAEGRIAVVLDRMGDGHFFVRAEVNGALTPMIVDTGATTTVLTSADARRAGFDPSSLSYTLPVMTANGTARAARVTVGELKVGDIARQGQEVMVAEEGRLAASLLGMNFLSSLSGFDVRGDRLTLYD
ncbi:MAG: TIGR02281 family clan AA aspartic protease [Rhizobiaceae bacterium]|nr:TIGR02281 family clan AA aspartic protease [Rhizobiaceae bacterium]